MPSTTQQRGSPARVLEAPSHYKRTSASVAQPTTWNASIETRAFKQREWTTAAIQSAASAVTSVSWAQRLLPKASKNLFKVALSRPGAAQINRPVP
jgi:hypothetical protein